MWVQGPMASPLFQLPNLWSVASQSPEPRTGADLPFLCNHLPPPASPGVACLQLDHSSGLWLGRKGQPDSSDLKMLLLLMSGHLHGPPGCYSRDFCLSLFETSHHRARADGEPEKW